MSTNHMCAPTANVPFFQQQEQLLQKEKEQLTLQQQLQNQKEEQPNNTAFAKFPSSGESDWPSSHATTAKFTDVEDNTNPFSDSKPIVQPVNWWTESNNKSDIDRPNVASTDSSDLTLDLVDVSASVVRDKDVTTVWGAHSMRWGGSPSFDHSQTSPTTPSP